jgi:hypothetical protein
MGVDFKVSIIELPLYIKVFNFYDRHFNYKQLVKRIVGQLETKEEKVFRLFKWTYETIRRQPDGWPVMDDHVWNVYVRGYGVQDNFNDLFTTLCNYVGVDAFFKILSNSSSDKNKIGGKMLSFVHLQRGWVIFDPYHGVYFVNKNGGWATIEEIKNQNWGIAKLVTTDVSTSHMASSLRPYLEDMPVIENMGLRRANIQSPINRLRFEFGKLF